MQATNNNHPGKSRSGLAAAEFALVLPFLVFLAIGMIEMGRGLQVKEILSDAARKGCRTGIQPLATNTTVSADVNNVLTDNNITASDATITIQVNGVTANVNTAKQNDKISVKVSIPVSKIAWITPLFLPGSSIESSTMVMLRQR